ncbi:11943_t:CDS:1, partial [Gigaspora rosea]
DESISYSRKRSRNSNTLNLNSSNTNTQIEPLTIDIGIQVEINNDLLMQNKNLKNSLNNLVTDHSKQLQVIEIKNSIISELEHKCEYFKKQVNDLSFRLKSFELYKNQ